MTHDPLDADVDSPHTTSRHPPPPSYISVPIPSASATHNPRGASSIQPSSTRAPVEHAYSLLDSRNASWAILKLLSNVGSPRFLPAYFDGQTIRGALELDLRKPETILGISVSLSGTIVAANAPDPRTFWELTHVLWSAEMGDPRSVADDTSSSPSPSKGKGKRNNKLAGSYAWPFAITLPSVCTVTLRPKDPPVTLPLPPSFSEKGASQFVNYELIVRIRRGPLRIDSKLGTHFGFAPRTRPPAPSLLRQLAHQENRSLLGPEGDPDGWSVLPPIIVRGKLFGVRIIEVVCTFAVALPLTYARGHSLPLMLTVSSTDVQALDLVFAPQNVSVHLIREVCYDNGTPGTSYKGNSLESSPADRSLGITASSPSNFGSSPRAFLPRAAATSPTSSASSSFPLARPTSMYSHLSASASTSTGTAIPPPSTPALSRFSSTTSILKSEKKSKTKPPKVGPKLALHGARTPVTSAVWWARPNPTTDTTTQCRRLEGEIMLPKDLVPSFEFGGFSVKYALALLPFQVPGFELLPSSNSNSNSNSTSPTAASQPTSPILPPPSLTLSTEPLFLSSIQVTTLPFASSHFHTPNTNAAPRSHAPRELDAQAQRAAHAERLRTPIVWGLFNQFVDGAGAGAARD